LIYVANLARLPIGTKPSASRCPNIRGFNAKWRRDPDLQTSYFDRLTGRLATAPLPLKLKRQLRGGTPETGQAGRTHGATNSGVDAKEIRERAKAETWRTKNYSDVGTPPPPHLPPAVPVRTSV